MIRLAHIVNPVSAPPGSELHRIQPVTYESIRRARDFGSRDVDIELYAVGYEEDRGAMPDFFSPLPDLDRSVLDFGLFDRQRRLPLIADILARLYHSTDSEWLIYTNADICLMPQFYSAVASVIAQGHDAIMVTRRRISQQYGSVGELPLMYSEIGGSHPGYDCFVFHRSLFECFVLGHICIAVPFIEVALLHNLIAFAKNIKYLDTHHLTFHIGMEVMPPIDPQYYRYNKDIYMGKILPQLKPFLETGRFPYASQPFHKRMVRWGLNPCISSALMLELEGKSLPRKVKMMLDEIRWRIISR